MKKHILLFALLVSFMLSYKTQAQVSVNFNLGLQPMWGPVGYDEADYYYMPDIDVYYNVPRHQYIYLDGGRWLFSAALPPRYHNYDLYSGYKVVINEPYPYRHHDRYKTKYASYRGRHGQEVIRNSHDERYFENKNHPEHNKWKGGHGDGGERGHGGGNYNGGGRDKGHGGGGGGHGKRGK